MSTHARLREAARVLVDRAQVSHEMTGTDVSFDLALADLLDYRARFCALEGVPVDRYTLRVALSILRSQP